MLDARRLPCRTQHQRLARRQEDSVTAPAPLRERARPLHACPGRDEGENGARGGCQEVCPAKGGQPGPAEDRRLAPAPGILKLGGREQGEHRSAHAKGYCYVAREAEGALADEDGQRRQADADTPTPQRNRPRGQPALSLRSPERVRGAGRGLATVTVVCGTRTRVELARAVSATARARPRSCLVR